MNNPIVFMPHATRDLNADRKHRQFSRFRQWLFGLMKRPLIAQPPKAEIFRIDNPTKWRLSRERQKISRARLGRV